IRRTRDAGESLKNILSGGMIKMCINSIFGGNGYLWIIIILIILFCFCGLGDNNENNSGNNCC
ncbi:MAG: hypothetical protein LBK23_08000, partial [Oscillospiraceae bacterium]|nr:hypothetical protein [Oscillospiraceae bacterium]